MNAKVIALGVVLLGFLTMTALALLEHGYVGFFEWAGYNAATRLLFTDLCITLGLILLWMWNDARERSIPFTPYALVTLFFGAAGPLGYLIHRELRGARASSASASSAGRARAA